MEKKINIGGHEYTGYCIETENAVLLMIKTNCGFLGCGYFNIEAANKLNEHVALVTGVKTFADMLTAKVFAVSNPAKALGITPGITGKEALTIMTDFLPEITTVSVKRGGWAL